MLYLNKLLPYMLQFNLFVVPEKDVKRTCMDLIFVHVLQWLPQNKKNKASTNIFFFHKSCLLILASIGKIHLCSCTIVMIKNYRVHM